MIRTTVMGIILVTFIMGCNRSNGYGSEEAIKRGDIVFQNGIVNLDRFEKFLINLSNNKVDAIRITAYTHEGDPIFSDLKFDGKVIEYKYDNSNDEYGGNDRGVHTDVCTEIVDNENVQGETQFLLTGCSKKAEYSLIRVDKDKLKSNR
jgi:hypothetical protein